MENQKKWKSSQKKKNPKHFQSWSFKSHSKKLLCPLRTNQFQVKRQGHNLKGSHQSGTLQTVVTLEMFQVSLCEPTSFQPIFQMALDFILLGKLLSPSPSPLFSATEKKKNEFLPSEASGSGLEIEPKRRKLNSQIGTVYNNIKRIKCQRLYLTKDMQENHCYQVQAPLLTTQRANES